MRIGRWIVGAVAILMLVSCKIRIVVPEGGSVTTQSGAYSCVSGKTCNIDVVDFYFDQTFVAKPANGYKFKFWKKGDRRFCGKSSKPCHLFTNGFPEDAKPAILKFLEAADEVFYLQPVFEKIGASASSCSLYAGGTLFCADGRNPTCSVTREKAYSITKGMTYDQVVNILGCHGFLQGWQTNSNFSVGSYVWGNPILGPTAKGVVVNFTYGPLAGYNSPSVDSVSAYNL